MENYIVPHYGVYPLINRVNKVRQLIDIGTYALQFVQIKPTTVYRVRLTRVIDRPDAKIEDHLFTGTMQLSDLRALQQMKTSGSPDYPEGVQLLVRESRQCAHFFKVHTA